jgi:hypothetical protein
MVHKEDGRVGRFDVAIFLQVDDEVVVGEDASLGEAFHAFVDFAVDETIHGDELESVILDDGSWDVFQCHSHVLRVCLWGVQMKIFYFDGHELGAGGGDDTVQ